MRGILSHEYLNFQVVAVAAAAAAITAVAYATAGTNLPGRLINLARMGLKTSAYFKGFLFCF